MNRDLNEMSSRKLTVLLTILAGVLFLHGWYMSSEPELIAARAVGQVAEK